MPPLRYVKGTPLSLHQHPDIHECWLRDRIAADPAILGLGPLALKDAERLQPESGRLDLLLERGCRRYVLELMLGALNESHLFRCLEYWDSERRRFPAYDHCAVLVAEHISPRMASVVRLLAGCVPMLVLQVTALQVSRSISLHFHRTLASPGYTEPPPAVLPSGRDYWLIKTSPAIVALADECLGLVREFDAEAQFIYEESGIRLLSRRVPGLVRLRPSKQALEVRLATGDREVFRRHFEPQEIVRLGAGWHFNTLQFFLQPENVAMRISGFRRAMSAVLGTAAELSLSRVSPSAVPASARKKPASAPVGARLTIASANEEAS